MPGSPYKKVLRVADPGNGCTNFHQTASITTVANTIFHTIKPALKSEHPCRSYEATYIQTNTLNNTFTVSECIDQY